MDHLRLGKRSRRNETDDWSSIPNDILLLISQKLGTIKEYIRFSTVCRSWHSFATDPTNKPRFGPFFVSRSVNDKSKCMTLRNPTSDETLILDLPDNGTGGSTGDLPSAGSSLSIPMRLDSTSLIPSLEPRSHSDQYRSWAYPSKRISSLDSDPDDFLIVIVSGRLNKLAFSKPGGNWNYRPLPWYRDKSGFHDVTYFEGNLYCMFCNAQVVSFQPDSSEALTRVICLNMPRVDRFSTGKYLVELDGQLCLCVRYYEHYSTVDFKFFVIDVSTGNLTSLELLGDRCMFLDQNCSFSYKASYAPSKLFERHQYMCDEFVSNYVFYNDKALGFQVWDVLHSCKVLLRSVPSLPASSLCVDSCAVDKERRTKTSNQTSLVQQPQH